MINDRMTGQLFIKRTANESNFKICLRLCTKKANRRLMENDWSTFPDDKDKEEDDEDKFYFTILLYFRS